MKDLGEPVQNPLSQYEVDGTGQVEGDLKVPLVNLLKEAKDRLGLWSDNNSMHSRHLFEARQGRLEHVPDEFLKLVMSCCPVERVNLIT